MAGKQTLSMDQLNELIECFRYIKDPRVQGRSKHLLIDIIVISVCATLCGAEGISDIVDFAMAKERWLRSYLALPEGIPSYDTIARVLSIIDAKEMEKAFLSWVEIIAGNKGVTQSLSLDGKCSAGTERSFNRGKRPLIMVSAYSHELGLSLFETQASSENGGEVGASIECLEMLDLNDVLVNVDAGIGSHDVACVVREKGGDYIVPLKGNHRYYRDEANEALDARRKNVQLAETEENLRGRHEFRTCRLLSAAQVSEKFHEQWPGAKTVFTITRQRTSKDKRYLVQTTGEDGKQSYEINKDSFKTSTETTTYVCSRKLTAEEALAEVRKHWAIENKVHWVLDVAFREDNWAVRAKTLARTLSLIRKIALNIVRRSKTTGSVRGRMKKAAWSDDFLDQLLFC